MSPALNRRTFLGGLVATGVTMNFAGIAAAEGRTKYIVTTRGRGVTNRIEAAGFDVTNRLADGGVLIVAGPEGRVDDLSDVRGVQHAARNAGFTLEGPEIEEQIETSQFEPGFFWENQWDKMVTEVPDAHDIATGVGSRIAILDTGIDPNHFDLAPNVNEDLSALFSSGNPIPADDNPWDMHGHGTHVAGTAAATSGGGVIGTAPDAELVSLKVFWFEDPEGHEDEDEPFLTTTTADILAAIDAAGAIDADAANMSLGTPPLPPEFNQFGIRVAYERVIQHVTRQGTVVVASAGNSAASLQQGGFFTVPNSTAGAMSISATAPNDELAFFSNFGTNEIDVGAPGGTYETVLKTLLGITEWGLAGFPSLRNQHPLDEGDDAVLYFDTEGNLVVPENEEEQDDLEEDPAITKIVEPAPAWPYPFNLVFSSVPSGFAWFAGTSMAAPQVSGAVALLREQYPDSTAGQVEQAIKQSADHVRGQNDPDLGAGRLNVADMLD